MEESENKNNSKIIQALILQAVDLLRQAQRLLGDEEIDSEDIQRLLQGGSTKSTAGNHVVQQLLEGVFDGQRMIGSDGKEYTVPSNYASKSKLVEGDILKLSILDDGSFVYKQISPIPRRRVTGQLVYDDKTRQYVVTADGDQWKVLTASVTYFNGDTGDEVVFFIPKDGKSGWAAVENILKK